MAKGGKSRKTKVTASFRVDPDLLETAQDICRNLSVQQKKSVSFSSTMEKLLEGWVEKNRHHIEVR
jgi:hypothetical protein